MRVALTAHDLEEFNDNAELPAELCNAIKLKLLEAGIGVSVLDSNPSAPIVAHGALFRLVSKQDYETADPATQARAIPIRSDDDFQYAFPVVWSAMNCCLKLGTPPLSLTLDAASSTSFVVTENGNYVAPLGTIEMDSESQLNACFAPQTASPTKPELPAQPSVFATGAFIAPKFCELLAVYLEQVLRLHVLFSARAGKPRRVLLQSVTVLDLGGDNGRQASHTIICKFHSGSGTSLAVPSPDSPDSQDSQDSQNSQNSQNSHICLQINLCGGELYPVDGYHCEICRKNSMLRLGARCTLGCSIVIGSKQDRQWTTKHSLHDEFLRQFASVAVALRHFKDPKTPIILYDKLESQLDESIAEKYEDLCTTHQKYLLHDEYAEAMLASDNFRFNAKTGSLKRLEGGKLAKWHTEIKETHGHLFPLA